MTNIKIFVSHRIDKEVSQIKNNIYIPVRCGAVFDKRKNIQMLGDDTGDNISAKKDMYSELTVLYWAWKNQKADYYGLCHYRRYLSPISKNLKFVKNEHNAGCVSIDYLNDENITKYKLNEACLNKSINGFDGIFMKPIDLTEFNIKSNYEAMDKAKSWHNMKWIDLAVNIAKEKYPEMAEVIDTYLYNYRYSYLYNCFVMKKDIFNKFCGWLFSILFELEKRIDVSNTWENLYRTLGTTGEHFFGIWVLWMKKNNFKIKELPLLFVEHPEALPEIKPAFDTNNIAIACSSSQQYVPYLSVWLKSLLEHTNKKYNYDILVFEREISEQNKAILSNMIDKPNCSLRFINPLPYIKNKKVKIPSNYALECIFRVLSSLILKEYSKVIFTDIDMVIQRDFSELANFDLNEKPLAACKDLVWGALLNYPFADWKNYCNNILKLDEPYKYYNTGVMVINVKKWNQKKYTADIMDLLEKQEFKILEQDALNHYFKDNIEYLDTCWNYNIESIHFKRINLFYYMPLVNKKQYEVDGKNPAVIHWAGESKPWLFPDEEMANIWWQYARQSPFYEEILARLMDFKLAQKPPAGTDYNTIYMMEHPFINFVKKISYKIKKQVGSKAHRAKYKEKYNRIKFKLEQIKHLKKQIKKI